MLEPSLKDGVYGWVRKDLGVLTQHGGSILSASLPRILSFPGVLTRVAESLKMTHSESCGVFRGSLQIVWSTAVLPWLLRQEGQHSHWTPHRFGSRRKVMVWFCFYTSTVLQPVLSFVVFEKCHQLQRLNKSPGEHWKSKDLDGFQRAIAIHSHPIPSRWAW